MTVTTTANSISYAGNGTTKAFAFPYIFFAPSDLNVTLIVTATNVPVSPPPVLNGAATYDYTMTGVVTDGEYASGVTVTFNTAPISGYTVLLVRNVPATQTVTLIDNTKFPAATINTEFDKLTVLSQQSAFLSGVSLQIPSYEVGLVVTAAPVAARANKLLLWDAAGNLSTIDTANIIGGSVPAGPASGDLSGSYPSPSIKTNVNLAGSPTTTTQPLATSNTTVATTAYVKGQGGGIIREVTLAAPAATIDLFSLGVKTVDLSFYLVPTGATPTLYLRTAIGSTINAGATAYQTQRQYATNLTPGADRQAASGYFIGSGVSASGLAGKIHFVGNSTSSLGAFGVASISDPGGTVLHLGLTGTAGDGVQFAFTAGNFATGSFVRVIGWP